MRLGWLWRIVLAGGCAASVCGAAGAQVKVWEGTMSLPASDEAAADANPPIDASGPASYYPYAGRRSVLNTESTHVWRAVYLENEYLKCTVLPDLGGHIYTCVDKANGVPMFYANPSFKRALIALRGAWSAFGDEFNFPVSHNWMSISPVNWSYRAEADGSASVTVGNRDRVYGMDWQVEVVLRPKSALVEENVTLANPNDKRHRFYWWNNGAVQAWDDSKVWYPMQYTIEDGDIDTWPVNRKGRDVSLVGNEVDGRLSRFAYGTEESYMGIYHPHTDAGIVHYADHTVSTGIKFWSWGTTHDGLRWRKILSDNNSEYVELQSGLYRDQSTFAFLDPEHEIRFTEYWMPVRGIGRITRANPAGVLAMSRDAAQAGTMVLGFNSNGAVAGATVSLLDGAAVVYTEAVTLDPGTVWKHTVTGLSAEKKYTFVVKDAQGKVLLEHTEDKYAFTAPAKGKPAKTEADHEGSEPWVARDGARQEVIGQETKALAIYTAGLKKYRNSAELLKAVGRIELNRLEYKEAAEHLDAALKANAADAEAHYYRGLAAGGLGQEDAARTEWKTASASEEFRVAAGLLLAEQAARSGGAAAGLKAVEAACGAEAGTLRCVEDRVALKRASGDAKGAQALAAEELRRFPLSAVLRREDGAGADEAALDALLGADSAKVVDLARSYARLGMLGDAVAVLAKEYPRAAEDAMDRGALAPADDPLVAYYRGYYRQRMGGSASADFAEGAKVRARYVFANDAEDVPVLQAAMAANAKDANAAYLLGVLWYSRGQTDTAMEAWQKAYAANAAVPGLDATLGMALLKLRNAPAEAMPVLQAGLANDAENPKLYVLLDDAMQKLKRPAAERATMLLQFPEKAYMSSELLDRSVTLLESLGRKAEAERLSAQHYVTPSER